MKLRLAWRVIAVLTWVGCGGAFTAGDLGNDAGTTGTTTGGTTTGGEAGTNHTTDVGGNLGAGGDVGAGGAGGIGEAGRGGGTAGLGGGPGVGGTMGTGGAGTGGVGTGGAGGSGTGGQDGGIPDWAACNGPGQCAAIEGGCCGVCGVPQLPAFVGVNTQRVQEYHTQQCPLPVRCPACAMGVNPNIAARCIQGRCQPFDVRLDPEYSACQIDTDCHLRDGLGCCVCGATGGWVALSQRGGAAIPAVECAPNTACASCLPLPPMGMTAICSNSVCTVK
jgi:hypothetical protein